MKGNKMFLILFCLLFAAVCIVLYPTASEWRTSMRQARAVATYGEHVAGVDRESYDRLLSEAEEYNAALAGTDIQWTFSEEETEAYGERLRIDDTGIMGYIQIEKIDCLLPIYHGTDDAVLKLGVGHLEGTSLPVGGKSTHCILTAHRGLPSARLFTRLDELEEGDRFVIRTLDETYTYEVDSIITVMPDDLSALHIEEGEDYCTLVTCTPYGINTHRLLVRGHRVRNDVTAQEAMVTAESIRIPGYVLASVVLVPLALVLGVLQFVVDPLLRKRAKKKEDPGQDLQKT